MISDVQFTGCAMTIDQIKSTWNYKTARMQDVGLAKYSPGRILLLQMLQAAQSNGIQKIDLGRGVVSYKSRAMTGAVTVAIS